MNIYAFIGISKSGGISQNQKNKFENKMTYAERLNKIASSLFNSEDEINEAVEFMMYYSDLSDDEITNMTDQELINYMMVGSM